MEVYTVGLKVDADASGSKEFTQSLAGSESQADKTKQATARLSDEMRAYQSVANRTGETVDQVRIRFERLSREMNRLVQAQAAAQAGLQSPLALMQGMRQQGPGEWKNLDTGRMIRDTNAMAAAQNTLGAATANTTKINWAAIQADRARVKEFMDAAAQQQKAAAAQDYFNAVVKRNEERAKKASQATAEFRQHLRELGYAIGIPMEGMRGMTRAAGGFLAAILAILVARRIINFFVELAEAQKKAAEEALKLSDDLRKTTEGWVISAKTANSYSDALAQTISMIDKLTEAQEKARNAATAARPGQGLGAFVPGAAGRALTGLTGGGAQGLPFGKAITEEALVAFTKFGLAIVSFGASLQIPTKNLRIFSNQLEENAKTLKQNADALLFNANAMRDFAAAVAADNEALQRLPPAERMVILQGKVSDLRQSLEQLGPINKDNEEQIKRATAELKFYEEQLNGTGGAVKQYQDAIRSLTDEITQLNLAGREHEQALARIHNQVLERARSLEAENRDPAAAAEAVEKYKNALLGQLRVTEQSAVDIGKLNTFYNEYVKISLHATSQTEKEMLTFEAAQRAIQGMVEPMAHVAVLAQHLSPSDAALLQWEAYDMTVERSLSHSEERMKANMATMGETLSTGLQRMSREWGSMQTQVGNAIQGIGNALANDISTGLVDILMGTKSVKEGFREMAVAIIRDIEQIIIKMLVQLAIQQLLAAFGGGSVAGVGGYLATGLAGRPGYAQSGGRIGGHGRGDKVPTMLEPGEFVIPRDQAERFGYHNLEKIRRMASGGVVQHMRTGGEAGLPDLSWLHQNEYGPGAPHPSRADLLERVGLNDHILQPGDAALPYRIAQMYGLSPGDQFIYRGRVYTYFDQPNSRITRSVDIFRARGFGPPRGGLRAGPMPMPFRGARGAGRSALPDEIRARRLGFGPGGGDFRMEFDPWQRANLGIPGLGEGNRPGFPNFNFTPGGNLSGGDRSWYTYDPSRIGTGNVDRVTVGVWNPNEWIPSTLHPGYLVKQTATGDQYIPDPSYQARRSGRYGLSGTGGGGAGVPTTRAPSGFRTGVDRGGGWPGDYNLAGPGGEFGTRGVGWGVGYGHTVTNFYTAIGFGGFNVTKGGLGNFGVSPGQLTGQALRFGIMHGVGDAGIRFAANMGYGAGSTGWTPALANYWSTQPLYGGGFSGRIGGSSGASRGTPQTRQFHSGGVVDWFSAMASGGVVKAGEGVFTPEQMQRLSPVGGGVNLSKTDVQVIVQSGGPTQARVDGPGLSEAEARDIGRVVGAVVDAKLAQSRRVGGQLYVSRSQRGG